MTYYTCPSRNTQQDLVVVLRTRAKELERQAERANDYALSSYRKREEVRLKELEDKFYKDYPMLKGVGYSAVLWAIKTYYENI